MDENERDHTSMRAQEIERIGRGEVRDREADAQGGEPNLEERMERPVSRRDLLRGSFLREP